MNPTVKAYSDDLMKLGFLFVESDSDTAPEVIEKLRTRANEMEQQVNDIRFLSHVMEATLDVHTVERYDDNSDADEYVVIYTDALGRRWQDQMGTITKVQADLIADRKNAAR